jgi:hypothetical protein
MSQRTLTPRRWQKWTAEDDRRLETLVAKRQDDRTIARTLGRSVSGVTQRARRLRQRMENSRPRN